MTKQDMPRHKSKNKKKDEKIPPSFVTLRQSQRRKGEVGGFRNSDL